MAKDYITINYHKHHALPLPLVHVRSVASHNDWKAAYSEDDNVNSVAPDTSSEVKGPEADVGGTKPDQEELQCHHAENHWKQSLKTTEKHALPRTW